MASITVDDGDRTSVKKFMKDRNKNFKAFNDFLVSRGEYEKARVLMELIWEYEGRHPDTDLGGYDEAPNS